MRPLTYEELQLAYICAVVVGAALASIGFGIVFAWLVSRLRIFE